jgi:acetyl esterase/lipase
MTRTSRPLTPEARLRIRRIAGFLCLGLSVVGFDAMFTPPTTSGLWVPRLISRELAGLTALLALAAAILLYRSIQSRLWRGVWVVCAGLHCLLGSLPLTTVLPLFSQHGLRFSPLEYVFGVGSPAGIREDHDVALASDRPDLLVDVYRPAQPPASPVPGVVVIHGGSFLRGDKGDVPQVSRALAAAGFAVFDLRYRLAPQHPFPAAVQDVLCALGRLAEPAARERFSVDGRRLAVLGRSAGGTLALSAAYAAAAQAAVPPGQPQNAGQNPAQIPAQVPALRAGCAVIDVAPRAVVGIYPWTDLRDVYEHPHYPDPLATPETMAAYLGGSPQQLPGPYAHASPLYYATLPGLPRGVLPATLLIHGLHDSLVRPDQSQRLQEALGKAGYSPQTLYIPMAEHGFDHRPGGAAEQLERGLVVRFLKAALANP